jgi:hypothetical protein
LLRRVATHPFDKLRAGSWFPLVALLLFAQVALLGPLLWGSGLPKGLDMTASLLTGYEASNGSWHQIWDDAHFPGKPKHVSRFALSELLLTWLAELTGDPFLAARLMVWLLNTLALVTMYLLAASITRSKTAGVVAAVIYVFSRGSLLRTGVPLAAGYALAPLLFLAVDRMLERPSLNRAVLLALAAALFATSTVPGFTYVVAVALAVYVIAFFVARGVRRDVKFNAPTLGRTAGLLILGLALAIPLSAYYLVGLVLSTVPLIRETGGYDVTELASGLPSLGEALALSLPGFRFNTLMMDVAAWALAATAVAASLLKVSFRVVALLVIASGAVFFATNVDSLAYRALRAALPYFEMVRGPARWLGLALLAYSLLLAIGLAAALGRMRERRGVVGAVYEPRLQLLRYIPLAVATLVVGVVIVNVGVQLLALRQWTTPYQLPEGEVAPFEQIAASPPDVAYATAPLLEDRIYGPPHLAAIDFGRTVGPAVSGRTALGGFRAGGLQVRNEVWAMLQDMRTPDVQRLETASLGPQPVQLSAPVADFWLTARAAIAGVAAPDGFIQIQFHQRENQPYYAFTLYPATGRVELARGGSAPAVLASSLVQPIGPGEHEVRIVMSGSEGRVWLDGAQVLETSAATAGSGRTAAHASGVAVTLSDVEVAPLRRTARMPDTTLAKVMGLFNMRYLVVQPHTSQVERQRIASLPGLRQVGQWDGAALYENGYYTPGKAFFTPMYGVHLGDAATVVPALYHLDALALNKVGLVSADGIPAERVAPTRGEPSRTMLSQAWFLAIDAEDARTPQLTAELRAASGGAALPPAVYAADLAASPPRAVPRPYPVPRSLLVTEQAELLSRARNFVLEATLASHPGASETPSASVSFRVQDARNYYTVELDGAAGRIAIARVRGGAPSIIGQASLPALGQAVKLRLAVEDSRFQAYLDDSLALQAQDDAFNQAGPIFVSSQPPGALVSEIGVATDRDGQELRELLTRAGFDVQQVARLFPSLDRDHFGLFPDMRGYSARMRGLQQGNYRLLVSVADVESELTISAVDNAGVRLRPAFSKTHREAPPPGYGTGEQIWLVSEPLEVKEGQADVFVAAHGPNAQVRAVMLVQVARAPDGRELVDALLSPPAPVSPQLSRRSATDYRGALPATEGGMVIFQDSFDAGWKAHLGGEELAHAPAFGALNGFWIPSAQDGGPLELRYTPQSIYRWGMVASGLAFLALAMVGTWRLIVRSPFPLWRHPGPERHVRQ